MQADAQSGMFFFEDLKGYNFRVKNNGTPIPPEILPKIFEPGYTTKGDAGEGMGLAISRDILTGYGGYIQATSDGEYTIFEGWLPKG